MAYLVRLTRRAERNPHIYRVIFQATQRSKTIHVLHIRHGARDGFEPDVIRVA
jgi:hypothetical protein